MNPLHTTSWSNHVTLVTGGGRGIGAAICRQLGAAGAAVAVNDADGDAATEVRDQIRSLGGTASAVTANITQAGQVEQMFSDVAADLGPVTDLVNNAGVVSRSRIEDFSDEEWHRTLDVNLDGAYLCLKHFTRARLDAGGHGSVVNISSMSYKGMTQQVAYVASKGAVVSMTKGAAIELARHGIRVNCVAPGMIETRLTQVEEGGRDSLREAMMSSIPLRRYGDVEEIANVIRFLISDDASYLTGEVLHVSGGARL